MANVGFLGLSAKRFFGPSAKRGLKKRFEMNKIVLPKPTFDLIYSLALREGW